jgi:hypothetical protein
LSIAYVNARRSPRSSVSPTLSPDITTVSGFGAVIRARQVWRMPGLS